MYGHLTIYPECNILLKKQNKNANQTCISKYTIVYFSQISYKFTFIICVFITTAMNSMIKTNEFENDYEFRAKISMMGISLSTDIYHIIKLSVH